MANCQVLLYMGLFLGSMLLLLLLLLSRFSHVQLYATAHQVPPGSSVPGILQATILEWVAIYPKDITIFWNICLQCCQKVNIQFKNLLFGAHFFNLWKMMLHCFSVVCKMLVIGFRRTYCWKFISNVENAFLFVLYKISLGVLFLFYSRNFSIFLIFYIGSL